MKNIKTRSLLFLSLIIILSLTYILQSSGGFRSTYNRNADTAPDNGKVEIQKIVYSPLFGDDIMNENTDRNYNNNKVGEISTIEKIDFYNKAFLQIIDRTIIATLIFFLILFFIRRVQQKKLHTTSLNRK